MADPEPQIVTINDPANAEGTVDAAATAALGLAADHALGASSGDAELQQQEQQEQQDEAHTTAPEAADGEQQERAAEEGLLSMVGSSEQRQQEAAAATAPSGQTEQQEEELPQDRDQERQEAGEDAPPIFIAEAPEQHRSAGDRHKPQSPDAGAPAAPLPESLLLERPSAPEPSLFFVGGLRVCVGALGAQASSCSTHLLASIAALSTNSR